MSRRTEKLEYQVINLEKRLMMLECHHLPIDRKIIAPADQQLGAVYCMRCSKTLQIFSTKREYLEEMLADNQKHVLRLKAEGEALQHRLAALL